LKFLAAFQFLTSIPVPGEGQASPQDLGRSTGYFPLVGLIIGLILAGLNWLCQLFLPPSLVSALLLIAVVIITGALHLDGLADTLDGIAGQKSTEERWQAMRDSRAGAFGIIGIVLLLLVKYVSLNSLPTPLMTPALVLMPTVSRWAMVYAIFVYPYARPSGLGQVFQQETNWPQFTLATIITLVVTAALVIPLGFGALMIMFLIWLLTVVMAAYFKSRFSGLTGDNYGAIGEVAEVMVLVMVIIFARLGLA